MATILMGLLLLGGSGCQGSLNANGHNGWPGDGDHLTIRPIYGDVSHLLRNVHYLKLMGRSDLALKELEEAYRQQPQDLKLLDALARCYEELGDFDKAQSLHQKALALDESNPALWNNLCYSYYLGGQWDKAEACFRQALSRNPHNVVARNNLGLLLCRLGKEGEAQRLWAAAEGEKLAQAKMQQVLASLGRTVPAHLSPGTPPEPAPVQVARNDAAPHHPKKDESTQPQPLKEPPRAKPPAPRPEKAIKVAAHLELMDEDEDADLEKAAPPSQDRPEARPARSLAEKELVASARSRKVPEPLVQDAAPASLLKGSSPEYTGSSPGGTRTPDPGDSSPSSPLPAPKVTSPKKVEDKPADHRPGPKPDTPTKPKRRLFLTAKELIETGIEVLNGNGAPDMAHNTRSLLSGEGFYVARIGNYIDWGAEQTIIRHRPESERVAQALQQRFFQQAQVETDARLPEDIPVRILLGRDLLGQQDLLASLAD
ncbi:MAG: tetratricopeptide repeat protein [Thermodesulfobacteriota bacterium]